jgi:hypothetical protein
MGEGASPLEASCGSASCFVVIGSQQQVSPAGVFTINLLYTNTPNGIPPDGANTIPYANQQKDQLILANNPVSQLKTLVETVTLDINYGLTKRLGLELMVPYRIISSVGQIGAMNGNHGPGGPPQPEQSHDVLVCQAAAQRRTDS